MMQCSKFRKDLSAFLDNELAPKRREQMEIHISECADCRQEAERIKKVIRIMGSIARPDVPIQLWETMRQKLGTVTEKTDRTWRFRIPKWSFIPAGALVLMILLFLSSQIIYRDGTEPALFNVYLQEHASSYSRDILPSDLLSEFTIAQVGEFAAEDVQPDEPITELEMLMEVHYGTDPTDGS